MSALLRMSPKRVIESLRTGALTTRLSEQMAYQVGQRPSLAEIRSWEASLPILANDLIEAGLESVELLIEFQLPYTSKRADVVICGIHPASGKPSILIVELKQWSQATSYLDVPSLVRIGAYGDNPVTHPAVQVRSYCEYLTGFNLFLENSEAQVSGAAYLHNWQGPRDSVVDQIQAEEFARVFLGSERGKWINFLKTHFTEASGATVADQLLSSKLAPTKQLMQHAAAEIKDRSQFILLDEQQVAFELVLRALRTSDESNNKTAVIVTGGPGSGKSVIALALLGELSRQGRTTLHATGSKAFRTSLQKIAGHRSTAVKNLFRYFNSFNTAQPNSLDVLICDEAHRIRSTSANRYTPASARTGSPQIDELLRVARVPVFLLDSHQVVRKGEIGTPEYIEGQAGRLGIATLRVDLDGQFRCGGSKGYETWILNMLGLETSESPVWKPEENYRVLIASSPAEMESTLKSKIEEGFKARMTAGFCWAWNDPNPDETLPLDVQIGDWKKPWNVKGDRGVGQFMAGSLWAIDPESFDQIGCVYTAQGFEYDWNGVIFGPDLVWRTDHWVGVPSGSKDPDMRGIAPETFQDLVKNTYKVLLTRGLFGTVLFSVDPETQEHLKTLVSG